MASILSVEYVPITQIVAPDNYANLELKGVVTSICHSRFDFVSSKAIFGYSDDIAKLTRSRRVSGWVRVPELFKDIETRFSIAADTLAGGITVVTDFDEESYTPHIMSERTTRFIDEMAGKLACASSLLMNSYYDQFERKIVVDDGMFAIPPHSVVIQQTPRS